MNREKHLEVATDILENVIFQEFHFVIYESQMGEDGNYTKLYSKKSDRLLSALTKILEKEYGK